MAEGITSWVLALTDSADAGHHVEARTHLFQVVIGREPFVVATQFLVVRHERIDRAGTGQRAHVQVHALRLKFCNVHRPQLNIPCSHWEGLRNDSNLATYSFLLDCFVRDKKQDPMLS